MCAVPQGGVERSWRRRSVPNGSELDSACQTGEPAGSVRSLPCKRRTDHGAGTANTGDLRTAHCQRVLARLLICECAHTSSPPSPSRRSATILAGPSSGCTRSRTASGTPRGSPNGERAKYHSLLRAGRKQLESEKENSAPKVFSEIEEIRNTPIQHYRLRADRHRSHLPRSPARASPSRRPETRSARTARSVAQCQPEAFGRIRRRHPKYSAAAIARWENLRSLDLTRTAVTSRGLGRVGIVEELERLNLTSTGVDDVGMEAIRQMPALRRLSVFETQVTDSNGDALKEIQAALPK